MVVVAMTMVVMVKVAMVMLVMVAMVTFARASILDSVEAKASCGAWREPCGTLWGLAARTSATLFGATQSARAAAEDTTLATRPSWRRVGLGGGVWGAPLRRAPRATSFPRASAEGLGGPTLATRPSWRRVDLGGPRGTCLRGAPPARG